MNFYHHLINKEIITKIPDIASFEWGGDDHTILYTKMDTAHRPYQVWKNNFNDPNPDKLIFEEADELFWLGISKSSDRELLYVFSSSKETSEVSFLYLNSENHDLKFIRKRKQGVC